jgi:hypothetical protein
LAWLGNAVHSLKRINTICGWLSACRIDDREVEEIDESEAEENVEEIRPKAHGLPEMKKRELRAKK